MDAVVDDDVDVPLPLEPGDYLLRRQGVGSAWDRDRQLASATTHTEERHHA